MSKIDFMSLKTIDFCDDVRDGTHDSPKHLDFGKLLITSKNIKGDSIDFENASYISEEDYNKINERSLVEINDVLYSMIGTVGLVYRVDQQPNYAIKNMGLFKIHDELKSKWIYYYLNSPKAKGKVLSMLSGSTQKFISLSNLRNLEIEFPQNIDDAKRIIKICESIDKKIKLNNEINNNLHELLKNQYYKMFVEGKKESWIDDKLGNYLSVDRGLSYKGQFLSETGVPMINLGNVMPNGVFRIEKNKYYSGDYKDKVTIKVGDIVIANTDMTQNREVIGTPIIVPPIYGDKIIFSHHIYGLRNLKLPKMYIFYTLLTDEWNAIAGGSATGTTVLALPKETIENYVVAIPDNKSLQLFDNIAETIQSKRNQILLENIKLEQLRDTLLPKLMNGEIDLDNIEI